LLNNEISNAPPIRSGSGNTNEGHQESTMFLNEQNEDQLLKLPGFYINNSSSMSEFPMRGGKSAYMHLATSSQIVLTPETPVKQDENSKTVSPIVEEICKARVNASAPKVGPNLKARATISISRAALGPGTWSPLTRPLIYQNRVIVGTESALARGPEGYRNTTGLILCEVDAPWSRKDFSRSIHTETEFVGTDSALQDIEWLSLGQSCVYATETELGICSFERRKHVLEVRNREDLIRQLAVFQDKLATGGHDAKICLYNVGEGRKARHSTWEMDSTVGGLAWYPHDPNVLTYTEDGGVLGLLDIRASAKECALRCDLGRRNLFAHVAATETMFALGYEFGYGALIDIRRPSNMALDTWRDPVLDSIGELIDSSNSGEFGRARGTVTVATGIGGLSSWDFSNGEAKCIGQDNPLNSYSDFPLPPVGFKTSGAFVPNENMVYAQTDSAGYFSLYDIGKDDMVDGNFSA
jgi:hypothetical protein